MKYEEIKDKNLFKNWLGASEIKSEENTIYIKFNDWDCYDMVCKDYCYEKDYDLSKSLDDMELIMTKDSFEKLLWEYDLELETKDALIVWN